MRRRRTFEERVFTAQRAVPGLGGGRSGIPAVTPEKAVTERSFNRVPVIWSMNPASVTTMCPVHTVREGGPLGVWLVTLEPASAVNTTIQVFVNNVLKATFTLAAGLNGSGGNGDWDLTAYTVAIDDRVKIAVTAAGDDAVLAVHTPLA